jgi:Zn-dependent oligopeptidase
MNDTVTHSLKFNYSPKEIKKIGLKYINELKDIPQKLKSIHDPNEFLNYYLYNMKQYDYIYQVIIFLKDVSNNPKVRKASTDFMLKTSNYSINFYKSSDNYKLMKKKLLEIKIPKNDVHNTKKLIYRLLKPFKEYGAHLSPNKKKIFIMFNKKLIQYENRFSENISNDIREIQYKESELDGIDEVKDKNELKNHFFKKINGENIYIFKTTYPDEILILDNCKNPESRKRMYEAFNSVAKSNLIILKKILILRQKISQLLGYKNSVEKTLIPENRIASLSAIEKLIKKMKPILKRKVKKELHDINRIFNSNTDLNASINDYDLLYYSNIYKKKFLKLDSNIIREYFPCNYTISKIMTIFGELYGIKFDKIKADKEKYWNNGIDIDLYKVSDLEGKDILGYLYLDLYPRDGKYTHAATFELQNTYYNESKRIIPITALVCNFNRDYLLFGEVTTFCHELGHAIHSLVSNVKYEELSGITMELDFAEMPSQLFENWCYKKEFLKKISRHKKTNKPLDNKIIKNIILNKNYNCGIHYSIQLLYTLYDIEIHRYPISKITTEYLYNKWFEIKEELLPFLKNSDKTFPMCRFGHLSGGYNVGYYGYLWSNIYAYDAFSIFEKNGIFNKNIGIQLRKCILEKGAVDNTIRNLENFLKRKSNSNAFFKNFI